MGEVSADEVAQEDVLRFLHEKSGKASLREINEELSSQEAAEKAVVELEEMGLVSVNAGMVGLTERGLRRMFTGGMLRLRGSWEGFSSRSTCIRPSTTLSMRLKFGGIW
ncbi:MAG: hypothetical protein DRJ96_07465 [Thermoprotei archaeon]|nr:MAG: hypothetical protein DRJ67_04615 [Thermoprotei archaeon]RLE96076.1 MAG: hypothetical protein DRJ96_07465 [Thermoprotei archaeon]